MAILGVTASHTRMSRRWPWIVGVATTLACAGEKPQLAPPPPSFHDANVIASDGDITVADAAPIDVFDDAIENVDGDALATAELDARDAAPAPPITEADVVVHRDFVPKKGDASCDPPDVPADGVVNEQTDVLYAAIAGKNLQLDIAWPKTKGPHPLVVIIHGGGWSAGKRTLYTKDTRRLASIGYVAATIDYRLCSNPANQFPAGISDVRCAIRWLRANAATYDIDPKRVVALGASAGGHLAAMVGVEHELALDDGTCPITDQPVNVSAVVDYYGPVDLRAPAKLYGKKMNEAISEFLGTIAEKTPKKATLASPMAHVDASDPPTLILHGEADEWVPIVESRNFEKLLKKAKVPVYLYEPAGKWGLHGFPLLTTKQPERSCTTIEFLREATK